MSDGSDPRPLSFPNAGQAALLMIGALVLQVGCGSLVAVVVLVQTGDQAKINPAIFNPWVLSVVNVAAIGIILALALRATREPWGRFLTIRPYPLRLLPAVALTSLGLAVVLHYTDNLFVSLAEHLPGMKGQDLNLLKMDQAPAGAFLLVMIVAPLTEEHLYRGLILRGLLTRQRRALAVFYSAGLFALMHANLRQILLGLTIGSVFGWWFTRTRSVGPGLVGHALFNSVAWLAAIFPAPFVALGINSGESPVIPMPGWLLGGGLLATGLGIWWFHRAAGSEAPEEPPLLPTPPEPPLLEIPRG